MVTPRCGFSRIFHDVHFARSEWQPQGISVTFLQPLPLGPQGTVCVAGVFTPKIRDGLATPVGVFGVGSSHHRRCRVKENVMTPCSRRGQLRRSRYCHSRRAGCAQFREHPQTPRRIEPLALPKPIMAFPPHPMTKTSSPGETLPHTHHPSRHPHS